MTRADFETAIMRSPPRPPRSTAPPIERRRAGAVTASGPLGSAADRGRLQTVRVATSGDSNSAPDENQAAVGQRAAPALFHRECDHGAGRANRYWERISYFTDLQRPLSAGAHGCIFEA
jgi:hypothetical protein